MSGDITDKSGQPPSVAEVHEARKVVTKMMTASITKVPPELAVPALPDVPRSDHARQEGGRRGAVVSDSKARREGDMDHRLYGRIPNVMWFNRHGMGPFTAEVCLRANVHPSLNYPEARISFGQWGTDPKEMDFGGVVMTVTQAIALVNQLKAAISDVVKACPQLALAAIKIEVEDLS
jgi:hypothetical protein